MNQQSKSIHVMTVTPMQQVALRAALSDHFLEQAEEVIINASGVESNKDMDSILKHFATRYGVFEHCSGYLASPQTYKNTKARMLYLSTTGMRYLTDAISDWNPDNSSMEDDLKPAVKAVLPKLKKLVELASEFSYSIEELRKEGAV